VKIACKSVAAEKCARDESRHIGKKICDFFLKIKPIINTVNYTLIPRRMLVEPTQKTHFIEMLHK